MHLILSLVMLFCIGFSSVAALDAPTTVKAIAIEHTTRIYPDKTGVTVEALEDGILKIIINTTTGQQVYSSQSTVKKNDTIYIPLPSNDYEITTDLANVIETTPFSVK